MAKFLVDWWVREHSKGTLWSLLFIAVASFMAGSGIWSSLLPGPASGHAGTSGRLAARAELVFPPFLSKHKQETRHKLAPGILLSEEETAAA